MVGRKQQGYVANLTRFNIFQGGEKALRALPPRGGEVNSPAETGRERGRHGRGVFANLKRL